MITTNEDGWLIGDCEPRIEKADDTAPMIVFTCARPSDVANWQGEEMFLRPARSYIEEAYPEWNYKLRSNTVRSAVTQFIKAKWGPLTTGEPWQPEDIDYGEHKGGLEALFGHKLWSRFTVIGRLLHVSIPKKEVGLTVDFVVLFNDGSGIGLFAVWNKDQRIDPNCAWAELGAAALAFEESKFPVAKLVVIWLDHDKVDKIEVKSGANEEVNDCVNMFFDVLSEAKRRAPKRILGPLAA